MNTDITRSITAELCHCGRGRDHHVDAHRPGPDLMDGGVTATLIEKEARVRTTDDFTTAARAEAFRVWFEEPTTLDTIAELGAHMAEWARDHLAAQEPTDAEVEAARKAVADAIDQSVRALVLMSGVTLDQFQEHLPGIRDSLAATATHAALSTARAVRQEK